jgi:hypothetical protein
MTQRKSNEVARLHRRRAWEWVATWGLGVVSIRALTTPLDGPGGPWCRTSDAGLADEGLRKLTPTRLSNASIHLAGQPPTSTLESLEAKGEPAQQLTTGDRQPLSNCAVANKYTSMSALCQDHYVAEEV